jgi:TonB family protein
MTFTLRDTPAAGGAAKPPVLPVRRPTPGDTDSKSRLQEPPVYTPGQGVTAPVLVREVKPRYTPDAKDAKIQGVVTLQCVVQPDGTVGDVEVTKSLDAGLDDEAIAAVKQWRFEPGKKDGKPIPVRITLEMTFSLR